VTRWLVEIFVLFLSPAPVAFLFLFPVLSLETTSFSQEKRSVLLVPSEVVIYFF
jgi:hypothetical protein